MADMVDRNFRVQYLSPTTILWWKVWSQIEEDKYKKHRQNLFEMIADKFPEKDDPVKAVGMMIGLLRASI